MYFQFRALKTSHLILLWKGCIFVRNQVVVGLRMYVCVCSVPLILVSVFVKYHTLCVTMTLQYNLKIRQCDSCSLSLRIPLILIPRPPPRVCVSVCI